MKHHVGVRARLRERFRQLYKSDLQSFPYNARYFLEWAESTPVLAALLASIRRGDPDLDPEQWLSSDVTYHGVRWPGTESGRSKVVLWMLENAVENAQNGWMVPHGFSHEQNLDSQLRDFNDIAVEPLIDYLDERLSAETDLLYLFERYRRQVHWFEQDRLWAEYSSDVSNGEAVYDRHLRRFLFEQGVDFPFSQVSSPSGRADITLVDQTEQPLPLEVKLFDGNRYGVSYIAKGLGQAYRYAEDYDQPEGYLVVLNLTDDVIELPTDDPLAGWPPRIQVEDRAVFIVVVQAAPRAKASLAGKPRVYAVQRSDLVG